MRNCSNTNKRESSLNDNWKFYLGSSSSADDTDFNDSSWETVSIPHDFSITQDFTDNTGNTEVESGYLPGGTGWYRKHFIVDASDEGKTFTLSFDGSYENTYLHVNGEYVGENHNGYNSFAFDITDKLLYNNDENVIAVKVVHELPSSRWYSGSGIYRDVTLTVTAPVHVALNGTYITTPGLEEEQNGDVAVNVEAEIANDSDTSTAVTVRHTMLDFDGDIVSDSVERSLDISGNSTETVSAELTVTRPALWSVEDPNLYSLKTEVIVRDEIVDTYYTDYGFRYFKFDANYGFYLNGEAVKLKGVCLHHDQGALGAAAYDDAMERQLIIMKDMGCNAVRTSHNIADKDFIRLCNELGLLVMEEAFDGWSAAKNSNTHDFSEYFNVKLDSSNTILDGNSNQTWAEFVLKSMVLRDRNAPSIIMWDIGNEITNIIGNGSTSQYPTYASNMISWVQSLDPTRPITHGDNNGAVSTSSTSVTAKVDRLIAESGGVVGFNYYVNKMSTTHKNYPNWKLVATESVSSINSRGAYSRYNSSSSLYQTSNAPYLGNAYDNYCVFWGTTAHDGWYNVITNDYISGEFCWTGFDYIGEPTPWWRTTATNGSFTSLKAAPNSSYFGAVDTAGFPKDKYYFYRSQWNETDTTLHLVTAWDSDNQYLSNQKTPVWIYTNAPKIELYRTDASGNTIKLATSTRTEYTTAAGHSYGTYSSTINNSTYCTKLSTSGATALSARFNVTYTNGTIYAVAYDKNGNVIETTVGNSSVSTPDDAAKINAYTDKTEIDADGYSLSYITLDVTDDNGILDTAATNNINISLTGNGEIVGVDNGNPATTDKYQQASVLINSTSANIDAYAGKALVIVRSTKEAGEFTVSVSSNGLDGDSVTVTTLAVEEDIPDMEEPVPVVEITLDVSAIELKTGNTYLLNATILPEDASDKTIVWSTSDENIASVDDNGTITAIAAGTAVITASNGNISAACTVTVPVDPALVTEIILSDSEVALEAGGTYTLTATVLPEDASDKTLLWNSSDTDVASVDDNGTITAIAAGTTVITASNGDISAACTVTVSAVPVPITKISLSESALELETGDTCLLIATVLPEDASDKTIVWSTSNENTVSVDDDGTIMAIAPSTAVITVSCGNIAATCTITVIDPPEVIEKTAPTVTLEVEYKNSKIVITAQSDIGVNPALYYPELKHGILYTTTSLLVSRNLTVKTAGVKNCELTDYGTDGTFSYSFKPLSRNMSYTYRAYVYYEEPDGSRIYAYSPTLKGTARSFED